MVEVGMAIYIVKKRGGVWTVAASEVLLSFECYSAAIDAAQRAADDLERSKPSQLKTPSRLAVRENDAGVGLSEFCADAGLCTVANTTICKFASPCAR
jgi:hypothetical protein